MISPEHARLMARYNAWQNDSLYTAAGRLDDGDRRADRGAFFKSVHGTLNHILWADHLWMSRFSDWDKPAISGAESPGFFADWNDLKSARAAADARLIGFADELTPAALAVPLAWYSGVLKADVTLPRWVCLTHFFNHQTHHRGQTHALLTAAGARPEDTDLIFMPELAATLLSL
jgi:uncharacterized damage-inducible protein DinB